MYDPGFVSLMQHNTQRIVVKHLDGLRIWLAFERDSKRGEPVGRGATEQAAIADLMRQMGATCEQVAEELIGRGFSDAQVAQLMEK